AKFTISVTNEGNEEARLYSVGLHGMAKGEGRPADKSVVAPGSSNRIVRVFEVSPAANLTVPHAKHLYDGREFGEKFMAVVPASMDGRPSQLVVTRSVDVGPAVELANIPPAPIVR